MIRLICTILLLATPSLPGVSADEVERSYSDMPVVVLYCDEDPGRINAGGGKDPSPGALVESGLCMPAEGVALTFVLADDDWDFETDELADEIEWDVQDDAWFNRCDIGADGTCALNSPTGFDIVLGVVLHEGTVRPGYEPAFFQRGTHNFTEFAGYGLALIPGGETIDPNASVSDHQTLAVNIIHNHEPGTVLTEWQVNGEANDMYLATNTDGWVSTIVAGGDDIQISLVNIDDDAEVTIGCGVNEDRQIAVEASADDDGTLRVTIPTTESDLRCDVFITD